MRHIFIIFTLFVVSSQILAADVASGAKKASTCVACHMADGNSKAPIWPKIAGQNYKYLLKQLKSIKQGEKGPRYEPTMLSTVVDLSEQDLEDIAAYFETQTTSPGVAADKDIDLGESIYHGGIPDKKVPACSSCHGPKGNGNRLAGFPKLSSQHKEYTKEQLKKYKDKQRRTDTNAIMRDIAKKLSSEEIEAVSNYVEGLH